MNGEKGFFSRENELNKNFTHRGSCLYLLWFVYKSEHLKVEKKSHFLQGGKSHTKWVLLFSCNFMENVKQYPAVLFAHCRGDISLPNMKIRDNSISILYF